MTWCQLPFLFHIIICYATLEDYGEGGLQLLGFSVLRADFEYPAYSRFGAANIKFIKNMSCFNMGKMKSVFSFRENEKSVTAWKYIKKNDKMI